MRHRRVIARIRAKLIEAGISCSDIDRDFGLYTNQANDALREPNRAGEEAIAKALDTTPAKLWPNRYDRNGVRLSPQPRSNYRTRIPGSQRQNVQEAWT